MTNETRIAFAERLGWTAIEEYHYHDADGIEGLNPKNGERQEIPNINHTNLHTALMGMSEEEWKLFAAALYRRLPVWGSKDDLIILVLKTPLATLVECFLEATKGRVKP